MVLHTILNMLKKKIPIKDFLHESCTSVTNKAAVEGLPQKYRIAY